MKLLSIFIMICPLLMNNIKSQNNSKAYFGAGCFWCVEAIFEDIRGVENVKSGYSGGKIKNPTYKQICTGKTNHAEICEITYNNKKISYANLIEIFFLSHDPTSLNRQGNDVGTQYRSIIMYNNENEKKIIEKHINYLNNNKIFKHPIVTEIVKFKVFYKAENYHQDYYKNNINAPYCKVIISPKIESLREKIKQYY